MLDVFTKKTQKIRWINIDDFSEIEILKAYQYRNGSPICELIATNEMELWDAFVSLEDKNAKYSNDNIFDATYVSIHLRSLKNLADRAVDFSVIKSFISFIYNIKMSDTDDGKKIPSNKKVYICFRQESNGLLQDYFRLSEILRLWLVQNHMYDDVRFFDETKSEFKSYNGKYDSHAKRFAAAKKDKNKPYTHYVSGSVCPIISVNQRAYQILDGTYYLPNKNQKDNMAKKLSSFSQDDKSDYYRNLTTPDEYLGSYLYAYIEKVSERCRNIGKWEERWNNFVNDYKPPVLVVILLSTIVSNIIDDNDGLMLSDENWVMLVERCFSFAQGILQLIENANIHVVEKKNELRESIGNGAFFGFRVRNDINNILKSTSNEILTQCKHFIEIIVVDCDFSNQVGIIRNYDNHLKKSYDSEVRKPLIASLKEVFDYPAVESVALKEYYSKTQNVAFHYGLQIFSGVVTASEGCMSVVSGEECYGVQEMRKIQYNNNSKDYKLSGDFRPTNPSLSFVQNEAIQYGDCDNAIHFSGTSYTVLLPAVMPKTEDDKYNYFLGNISIDAKHSRNVKLISFDQYDCLWDQESSGKDNIEYILNFDLSSPEVLEQIFEHKQLTERKRIEYACKNLLVKYINAPHVKALCFTGFKDKYVLLDAVRVISLFYNKWGNFEQIKTKGIFLYCRYSQKSSRESGEYELYFNGSSLNSVFDNIQRQKLVRNIPSLFLRELETFLHRNDIDNISTIENTQNDLYLDANSDAPLPAAIIKYHLKLRGDAESVIQKQIKDILNNDIHENHLGCKISNTHVRIGKVHLDTFYEAQFLFGNAYCTDIFALYVADMVEKQIQHGENEGIKYDQIILCGYESYSTLTLYKAQELLGKGHMLVYEKINDRLRYLKQELFGDQNSKSKSKTLVVYVMGISSTLSTFMQMREAFDKACKDEEIECVNVDNLYLSVVQIDGIGSEKFIVHPDGDLFSYESKEPYGFTKRAIGNRAHFFVSASSEWYSAEDGDCFYCLPEHDNRMYEHVPDELRLLEERPLIEVDETSVVPTQMIFLNGDTNNKTEYDDICGRENAKFFLENESNKHYLRYGHIERYDNHFQYFLRLAELYHDKRVLPNDKKNESTSEQTEEIGIELWLKRIKREYRETFDTSKKTVNILIAPQHFSNTGYVNSVAKCVFGGTAHIIELDIRKEYRSNFHTKYSNYRALYRLVSKQPKEEGYRLNFYYVNDQIITGRTFNRAESLISTLLEQYGVKQNNKVFKGVFTLVDRNSYSTRKSYVEPLLHESQVEYLPFFSYLRFSIPSLRNHDNSCPLCLQNKVAEEIINSSALTSTAHYWQEKVVYHKQRTSDQMREIDSAWERETSTADQKSFIPYEKKKERNFRRLKCENELWCKIGSLKNKSEIFDTIVDVMLDYYPDYRKQRQKNSQRSLLNSNEEKLFQSIKSLPDETLLSVFRMVIARLCAVGSCSLLNYNRLIRCLKIGNSAYFRSNKGVDKSNEVCSAYEEYGEYLISFIKVMSRPLLFYREPVKSAVLKLLLKFFNAVCVEAESRINKAVENLTLDEPTTDVYYDKTFNGFLLNALKRLLCYDKGYSKCNYCDRFAFEKNDKNEVVFNEYSDFFERLYIENNRRERPEHSYDFAHQKIDSAQLGLIGVKYRIFIDELKKISKDNDIKIAFFAETSKGKRMKLFYEMIRRELYVLSEDIINFGKEAVRLDLKAISLLLLILNEDLPIENENNKRLDYGSIQNLLSELQFLEKSKSLDDGLFRNILSESIRLCDDLESESNEVISDLFKKLLKLLDESNILHNEEYYYVEGDEKDIPIPHMNIEEDFSRQSDESGIYYIRIGNNYNRFDLDIECENQIYQYRKELGLNQDAFIILGVKTTDIVALRRVLAFRKEIMLEAERDFNNSAVNMLVSTKRLARLLTRDSYVSHNEDPRLGFIANILCVSDIMQYFVEQKTEIPNPHKLQSALYYALYEAIDLYMETMIPALYKDLVKNYIEQVQPSEDGKTMKNLPKEHERSEAFLKSDNSQNISIDAVMAINFALDMMKFKYRDEVKFLYKKNKEVKDEDALSLFDVSDGVAQCFKDFQFAGWFIGTIEEKNRPEQYFEPFMIINTLIKNAKKYKGTDITVIFIKNSIGSIDLIVQNKYNKEVNKLSGHGMTLKALGNYFGTIRNRRTSTNHPMTCLTYGPDKAEIMFTVTVENYCIKKPSQNKE